tara:strand:+ start:152 stop:385 length:234 start_codon:yes stop_codon:yes gene_type:complete
MAFIIVDSDNNLVLNKPVSAFVFIAIAVGLGIMLFTLLLYGLIQAVTSSGFSELKASASDNGEERERIDDNEDLEDV